MQLKIKSQTKSPSKDKSFELASESIIGMNWTKWWRQIVPRARSGHSERAVTKWWRGTWWHCDTAGRGWSETCSGGRCGRRRDGSMFTLFVFLLIAIGALKLFWCWWWFGSYVLCQPDTVLQVTGGGAGSSTISSLDSGFVSQDAVSLHPAYCDSAAPVLAGARVSSATTLLHSENLFHFCPGIFGNYILDNDNGD